MTHIHLKPHGVRWEKGSFVEELWEELICKCDCGQILRLSALVYSYTAFLDLMMFSIKGRKSE